MGFSFSSSFLAQCALGAACLYLGIGLGKPMEGVLVYIVLSDVVSSVIGSEETE
jgi:hypothetical protein